MSIKIICPCGSELPYEQCCGHYHEHYDAPTALALMRSRYSAFCLGKVDYIDRTMQGKAHVGFQAEETLAWAKSVYWLGLQIIDAFEHENNPNIAYVEFVARFMHKGTIQNIHELSEFKRSNHQWYYASGTKPSNTDSQKPIKISRNAPCPCNSLKKFKNCHGLV